jgi:hypothetical protein
MPGAVIEPRMFHTDPAGLRPDRAENRAVSTESLCRQFKDTILRADCPELLILVY